MKRKKYDPDPDQNEKSDPDPNQNGLDPQHCYEEEWIGMGRPGEELGEHRSRVNKEFLQFFKHFSLFCKFYMYSKSVHSIFAK